MKLPFVAVLRVRRPRLAWPPADAMPLYTTVPLRGFTVRVFTACYGATVCGLGDGPLTMAACLTPLRADSVWIAHRPYLRIL